jgi:Phosphotransferase enzyme family
MALNTERAVCARWPPAADDRRGIDTRDRATRRPLIRVLSWDRDDRSRAFARSMLMWAARRRPVRARARTGSTARNARAGNRGLPQAGPVPAHQSYETRCLGAGLPGGAGVRGGAARALKTFLHLAANAWPTATTVSGMHSHGAGSHGDLGPWNTVYLHGIPVAFIDWDAARPVDPLADLAAAAWTFVPLAPPGQLFQAGFDPLPDLPARLRAFLDAHGLTDRIGDPAHAPAVQAGRARTAALDPAHHAGPCPRIMTSRAWICAPVGVGSNGTQEASRTRSALRLFTSHD